MTFRPVSALRVLAWGTPVGVVAPSTRRGAYAFEYEALWRRSGIELAPTLMPLPAGRNRVFTFPGLAAETFHGLPPMLADSVPDRFGNAVIDATLAREGVDPSAVSAIDRLAYVGGRGMGALTFEPDSSPRDLPTSVELSQLIEAARGAVRGELHPEGVDPTALDELIAVGTSAGGARAKAVLAWNPATGEMRAGGMPAPAGFEQWLLKFDGLTADGHLADGQGFGRVEYAYALMARAAGIRISECRLLEESGRAHFMTRRFDRPGTSGDRLHLQSLCAIAGLDFNAIGTNDYASLFTTLDRLGIADRDTRAEAFRRMCFNVLASNNDDHTKNTAFLMTPDGAWSLAPAYDLTFSYRADSVWTREHLMGVDGVFAAITAADLDRVADRFEVPGARSILAEVAAAVGDWQRFATDAGVPGARTEHIAARLALVRDDARLPRGIR